MIQQKDQLIENLTREIEKLRGEVDYYKNLSEYYRALYEGKNANVTNREVIELRQNMTIINNNTQLSQQIENIENKQLKISVGLGITLIGAMTILEIIFNRKKEENDE